MNERVLVTGASSGIGAELARLFAAEGSDLVVVARREARLRELAASLPDVDVRVVACDLAAPGAAACVREAVGDLAVDVLVNNAGFGRRREFLDLPLTEQMDMIRLNVAALTELTGLFLPEIVARGRGGVLNVGSLAGFQPGPQMAVYYATKAYVQSFSEALHEELRGTGVTVTCLAPGPVATEFGQVADMTDTPLFRFGTKSVASVARAGHRAFRRGRAVAVPGFVAKTSALLVRALPRAWVRRMVRRMQ